MLGSIWEEDRLVLDEFIHLGVVLSASVEWREADNHLIGEYSKSPPVNREGMTLFLEYFRSQVLGSAAE